MIERPETLAAVSPSPHEVRAAGPADALALGDALARAFEADPVWAHLLPPGSRNRMRRMRVQFRDEVGRCVRVGWPVHMTVGARSGALWAPPGHHRHTWIEELRALPVALWTFRLRSLAGYRYDRHVRRFAPEEPHWYLWILGTDPAAQGTGGGSAVIGPGLDRCDREGLPAYLESSREENVPFYRRFGFEVTRRIEFQAGPPLWAMWREPGRPSQRRSST